MTQRFPGLSALAIAVLLAARVSLCADTTNTAPDFREVYDLLRTNLTGATDETLNRAAVEGLLAQLRGKAVLVNGGAGESTIPQSGTALSKTAILESNIVYLRVGSVATGQIGRASCRERVLRLV